MKIGKIPESVLQRSVIRKISYERPEVILGAGVGEDCAAVKLGPDETFVLSTDPITGAADEIGHLAILVTSNDLASAGAEPVGIMLTILLPDGTEESVLKQIMTEVNDACAEAHIQVMGGHTEVTDAVTKPLVSVTGVGKVKDGKIISTGGGKPGMDLIVTKWIGLEGTSIIAHKKEEELLTHFPQEFVSEAKGLSRYLSVLPESQIAVAHGVAAMHDVTEGGIEGALWEMASASHCGLICDYQSIPIRQETVEISEYYHINPYRLISSGSMLMAAYHGGDLAAAITAAGIPAAVIGQLTDSNDRILTFDGGSEKRYLEPPKVDELYSVK